MLDLQSYFDQRETTVLKEDPFKGSSISQSNSINQFCAVKPLGEKYVLFMKRVNLCEAKGFRIDSPCFVFIMINSQGASNHWWFSHQILSQMLL